MMSSRFSLGGSCRSWGRSQGSHRRKVWLGKTRGEIGAQFPSDLKVCWEPVQRQRRGLVVWKAGGQVWRGHDRGAVNVAAAWLERRPTTGIIAR